MTHAIIVALSVLGVVAQVLCVCLGVAALAWLFGWHAPLDATRSLLWGYELWAAFVVAAVATGGSLFFSEIAHFVSVRALLVPAHSKKEPEWSQDVPPWHRVGFQQEGTLAFQNLSPPDLSTRLNALGAPSACLTHP